MTYKVILQNTAPTKLLITWKHFLPKKMFAKLGNYAVFLKINV